MRLNQWVKIFSLDGQYLNEIGFIQERHDFDSFTVFVDSVDKQPVTLTRNEITPLKPRERREYLSTFYTATEARELNRIAA